MQRTSQRSIRSSNWVNGIYSFCHQTIVTLYLQWRD
jgi:hypothetical protein